LSCFCIAEIWGQGVRAQRCGRARDVSDIGRHGADGAHAPFGGQIFKKPQQLGIIRRV